MNGRGPGSRCDRWGNLGHPTRPGIVLRVPIGTATRLGSVKATHCQRESWTEGFTFYARSGDPWRPCFRPIPLGPLRTATEVKALVEPSIFVSLIGP